MPRDERGSGIQPVRKTRFDSLFRTDEQSPSLSNTGEGFINWGYIVVEKDSILEMKRLSFSMPRLFDYQGAYRA